MNANIAQMVTDRIIEQMNKGIIPWKQTWIGVGGAVSHITGKPYSLINQMLLGEAGEYLTFKQIENEGGKVKKGAKARPVIYWNVIQKNEEENGEIKVKTYPVLRYYRVFHIKDTENINAKYTAAKRFETLTYEPAEKIVTDYETRESIKISRTAESGEAYYRPSTDEIVCPCIEQFAVMAEYYSTLFHEMVHSTGHKSRLDRLNRVAAFGSEDYSKEELVAELGSAMLCNESGVETEFTVKNSAAYIQNWMKALKEDNTLIISAASKAEKAVDYIMKGAEESKK